MLATYGSVEGGNSRVPACGNSLVPGCGNCLANITSIQEPGTDVAIPEKLLYCDALPGLNNKQQQQHSTHAAAKGKMPTVPTDARAEQLC